MRGYNIVHVSTLTVPALQLPRDGAIATLDDERFFLFFLF